MPGGDSITVGQGMPFGGSLASLTLEKPCIVLQISGKIKGSTGVSPKRPIDGDCLSHVNENWWDGGEDLDMTPLTIDHWPLTICALSIVNRPSSNGH